MSNSFRVIKTKIPLVKTADELVESYNYSVKTLNSSVMQIPDEITDFGVTFFKEFSSATDDLGDTYTFNHGLGKIPSGWQIIDIGYGLVSGGGHSFSRVSWTENQIRISIYVNSNTGTPLSGYFKLLVLR